MSKQFAEVFPTLKINTDIQTLMDGVEVTKVATNSTRDFIKVFIKSSHLIPKRYVYDLEQAIKLQLFPKNRIQVMVLEFYDLSEQYTPENLMEEYYESFLFELDQRSVVERNMLQGAKYHFEDGNVLCLQLEDTIVAQGKKEALASYLTDIFETRFRRPIEIRISYLPVKDSKLRLNNAKIRQEIDAILDRVESSGADHREVSENVETEAAEEHGDNSKAAGRKTDRQKSSSKKRDRYSYGMKNSDDPNLIYGRNFDDDPIELKDVITEMGEITLRGKVITLETREIRDERTILSFAVTDFTDTIKVKMFVKNEQLPDVLAEIKQGAFLKVKGVTTLDKFDRELTIGSVTGVRKIPDFTESRKDTAPEKRVELHCHTKMSDMDGVSRVTDLVKRAHDWGHKAIAITDHGVVQGFTDAHHYMQGLPADDPFKVIYGVEGYLADDLVDVAVNEKGQSLDGTFVVFDLETTGLVRLRIRL